MDVTGRQGWKITQETVEKFIDRAKALKFLYKIGIITQHDYWLLTGNYKIVD